jgi:outer membrane biosynthesis protein TonB
LNAHTHLAPRLACALSHARLTPVLALIFIAGLAGCRHKPPAFVIPMGAQAPVDLVAIPPPNPPLTIAELPEPELAPFPTPLPPTPAPRKRPTPAPKEEAQPPTQVAEAAPAELAIGTLSTGGDLAPQIQQQAQDMISSILKRIAALSAKTAEAEKRQLRQVRHFLDQAQLALNSGDTEGAKNLATKARQLMDDLEKK